MQHSKNKEQQVRAKKHLGQHFLTDEQIAADIVKAFTSYCITDFALEVGPGMGVLTKYMLRKPKPKLLAVDIDRESVAYLKKHFSEYEDRFVEDDFLNASLNGFFNAPFSLIGNFPYNISSQIIFKVIENKNIIPLIVGMFQKEVAERFSAEPRTKEYGILSVLTQAYYDVEYLFTVHENVFNPPPKIKSGVIRLIRKQNDFNVKEASLFRVVKTAFNQRRKKLRNALYPFQLDDAILRQAGFIDKRAEELSVQDFVDLTNLIELHGKTQY